MEAIDNDAIDMQQGFVDQDGDGYGSTADRSLFSSRKQRTTRW